MDVASAADLEAISETSTASVQLVSTTALQSFSAASAT